MRHNSFCIHSKTSFYAIDLNALTKFFPYLEITKPRDAEKIDTPAYLQKVSKVSLFLSEDQKPVIGSDGKPKMEEVEVTLPCFKAITVFDIEQTTGESIQTLAPEILTAAVEDYDLFLEAIREISPVPIRFDRRISKRLLSQSG